VKQTLANIVFLYEVPDLVTTHVQDWLL